MAVVKRAMWTVDDCWFSRYCAKPLYLRARLRTRMVERARGSLARRLLGGAPEFPGRPGRIAARVTGQMHHESLLRECGVAVAVADQSEFPLR